MSKEIVIMRCRVEEVNNILQEMSEDIPMDDVLEACVTYHMDRLVEVVNKLVDRLEKAEYERFYGGNK